MANLLEVFHQADADYYVTLCCSNLAGAERLVQERRQDAPPPA